MKTNQSANSKHRRLIQFFRLIMTFVIAASLTLNVQQPVQAAVTLTLTPITWNVIGLDSNDVNTGPNNFPVGARLCATGITAPTDITSTFVWDVPNPSYINLRPQSLGTPGHDYPTIHLTGDGCTDIYYEVEVTRTSAAYDQWASYHITATVDGVTSSTPTPRRLHVERLVSQARNSNFKVKLDNVEIAVGGALNLFVGQTYTIELLSNTSTNGYGQLESFINFPNTIFQILSVSSTYSAPGGPAIDKLYNDACGWENDPNSPNYLACLGDGKAGGDVVNTYTIKIISGGGQSLKLSNMVYDFSGSSYHYNSDYATTARIGNIIDPNSLTIAKSFSPSQTNAGGSTTLIFTLHNPNAAAISGVKFSDTLPTLPGAMKVAAVPGATTSGCGTPFWAPAANATTLTFGDDTLGTGTIAANSDCVVKVNVTAPVNGTYTNTTNPLFVGNVNTGKTATADLTVNNNPTPPACTSGLQLATWTFPTSTNPPTYNFKSSLAATVTQSISITGTSGVDDPLPYDNITEYAWYGNGNWGIAPWIPPDPPTLAPSGAYFEFVLDTSKLTDVNKALNISFNYQFDGNDWANSANNIVYLYTSTNGGGLTFLTHFPNNNPKIFHPASASVPAALIGSNTTAFRIYVSGAKSNGTPGKFYLDNITFSGCAVPPPPALKKTFSPNPVAVNGVSTLTFTLENENNLALSGVNFTDALPAGLKVAATPNASTTCTGTPTWAPAANATTLNFGTTPPGATIPARNPATTATPGSCTARVDVTATTAGPHQNVSGFVSYTKVIDTTPYTITNTTPTGYATALLKTIQPPQIAKQFSPNPILTGGAARLTFTLTNPNTDFSLYGVAFTDVLPTTTSDPAAPGAMTVADPPNATYSAGCAPTSPGTPPTLAAAAGAADISFSNGYIASGGTCTVTVNVTATTVGSYKNFITASALINGSTVNGNTATDTLLVQPVHPGLTILKRVSTSPAGPWLPSIAVSEGANVYYQFLVENTGDVPLTNVKVIDPDLTSPLSCTPFTLPGALPVYEFTTCTTNVAVTALSDLHPNTATAAGTYAVTDDTVSEPSTATYATTGLTITKSAVETAFAGEGDVLNYTYVVKNNGFYPLKEPVTVTDDKTSVTCPSTTTVGDGDTYLDPGESDSYKCTASYTVTAGDTTVTNKASAAVSGVTSSTDTVTVLKAAADYGDFPAAYHNTLQLENGARHTLGNLFMGANVTPDLNGQESDFANGDTDNGVTRDSATPWVNNENVNVLVNLSGATTFTGTVSVGIWVDWNATDASHTFEFIACTVPTVDGVKTCPITVPSSASYLVGTPIFVRVRAFDNAHLIGSSLDSGDIIGLANNGEVEDYWWDFGPTSITLASFNVRPAGLPFSLLALAALLVLALAGIALFIRRKHLFSR